MIRIAAIAILCLVGFSASAEPLKVRVGFTDANSHMTPILFQKPELLKHNGKSYIVEPIAFTGTSAQISALAAGEVDLASASYPTIPLAVTRAKLDVRVVSDLLQTAVDGYADVIFLAQKGRYKSRKDMKGAVIAVNSLGGGNDGVVKDLLAREGLLPDRDFTFVEVRFAAVLSALESGRADVGIVVPPFSVRALKTGKYEVVMRQAESLGPTQTSALIARAEWLEKNKVALADFFEDYLRAKRWALKPENRQEVIGLISKFMKQPADVYQDWYLTKEDFYRDPDGLPNLDILQKNIDDAVKAGMIDQGVDVRKYSDLSFMKAAAERLKSER
jgi:NitT/TauT family transport system substrate-binding protein